MYSNLYSYKKFEPEFLNYKVFLKNYFSQTTILWLNLNYEWKDDFSNNINYGSTYPDNETCYATEYMYSTSVLSNDYTISLKEYSEKHTINDYNSTSMLNIIQYDFPGFESDEIGISYNEINYNIIKYKTCYKTFLDQKK